MPWRCGFSGFVCVFGVGSPASPNRHRKAGSRISGVSRFSTSQASTTENSISKPVHAELMLHWQVSHHFLGSMIAIPLATMSTSRQIRTLESTLVQKWNPTLNYPFILKKRITKVGPDYSRSARQIASSYSAPGNRLHRKLRARLHKMGALSLYSTEKQEVHSSWMILTVLAEKSLASFNLQRRLRSCSYSLPHIYALIRLSNNLEEPPKSLVQKHLVSNP